MQQRFLLQFLLLVQHVSGTTVPISRNSRGIIQWLLPVVFRAVVFKLLVWCGAEGYVSGLQLENHSTKYHRQQPLYNTLELLMMGIVMPETC